MSEPLAIEVETLRTRVAVITLVQNLDFPTAWSSLYSLQPQLSVDRMRFVLVNDDPDPELRQELESLPNTKVLRPGENLGVARGRNALIEAALEWGAELVVTLDDDLLVPSDYLDRLVSEMLMGTAPDIASPILLDYHAVMEGIHAEEEVHAVEMGAVAPFMQSIAQADIIDAWAQLDDTRQLPAVHHMGIRDWESHYFAPLGHSAKRMRRAITAVVDQASTQRGLTTEVREDPVSVSEALASGGLSVAPIDCAPGGSTIYRAGVFEDLGLLEEAFSPFGFEDAEICVRANKLGLKVGLLESVVLLHDLQSRYKKRAPLQAAATRSKARVLLIRRLKSDRSVAATRTFGSVVVGLLESGMYGSSEGGAVGGFFAIVFGAMEGFFARLSAPIPEFGNQQFGQAPFVQLGRPSVRLAGDPSTHLMMPRIYSGSVPFAVPLQRTLVSTGFSNEIAGVAEATYRLESTGDLYVDKLCVTVPGLLEVSVSGVFEGMNFGGEPTDPLSESRVQSLTVSVLDEGFVEAFETKRAWLAGWPSNGLFRSMAKALPGTAGSAVRSFLEPNGNSKQLLIEIDPETSLTTNDLGAIDGGTWHIMRALGMTVQCVDRLPSAAGMGGTQ